MVAAVLGETFPKKTFQEIRKDVEAFFPDPFSRCLMTSRWTFLSGIGEKMFTSRQKRRWITKVQGLDD